MKLKRLIVKWENILKEGRHKDSVIFFKIGKWIILLSPIFIIPEVIENLHFNFEIAKIAAFTLVSILYLAIWLLCLLYCFIGAAKAYFFIKSITYTHQEFCKFINIFRKDKTELPKWKSYPLYVFSFIVLFYFIIMVIMMVYSFKNNKKKYPSDKYKKVIKKGIFWDSVEYHERCYINCSKPLTTSNN